MAQFKQTVLHQWHCENKATIVDFSGWKMPIQYEAGIIAEHLYTRRTAGLFDVSHMGRFRISGKEALPFLQHVLSNNAANLDVGQSQYTMIPDAHGGAIDDAYLYRFSADDYILVVNAGNLEKDWQYLNSQSQKFSALEIVDLSEEMAMISLQGPRANQIMASLLTSGSLPAPARNQLSIARTKAGPVHLARTGYTGEPNCFELFTDATLAMDFWDLIIEKGARPIGLGARDTLRLEAALPLYGHELGADVDGKQIPIFSCPLARFAVSFSELKADFVGKYALQRQLKALNQFKKGNYEHLAHLPHRILPILLKDKGIARAGAPVLRNADRIGYITSGTMVPYWEFSSNAIDGQPTDKIKKRSIGLAMIDSSCLSEGPIFVEVRGRKLAAKIVPRHLYTRMPPYARAFLNGPMA